MKSSLNITRSRRREPLTDTQLLLTITICIFFVMYARVPEAAADL